jgi:hypothetical protein
MLTDAGESLMPPFILKRATDKKDIQDPVAGSAAKVA